MARKKLPAAVRKLRAEKLRDVVGKIGLPQEAVAEMLGIKQPSLNQYLNEVIPIGEPFIFKFCMVFHIPVETIDPELEKNIKKIQKFRKFRRAKA